MTVDVDLIKRSNPIQATVERLTSEQIVRHKIFAPWRSESTPSVHIYDDDTWHDFGSGVGGDVIAFVGYYLFGMSYDPAAHFFDVIDKLGGIEIASLPARTVSPKPPKPRLSLDLDLITHWHETMPQSRREFWHGRGLTDPTINEFLLGWDGQRYTIPGLYRYVAFGVKRRISPEDFDRQTHERSAGIVRLSLEHPDWDDKLIGKEAPQAPIKYISVTGSTVGIFNSDVLIYTRYVVICEGEIDAMLMHQGGIPTVSSTGGAGSWKAEWAKFFTHIKDVFVIFDNDKAGREGARRVQSSIRRAKIVTLPQGVKDVGVLYETHDAAWEWLQRAMWSNG